MDSKNQPLGGTPLKRIQGRTRKAFLSVERSLVSTGNPEKSGDSKRRRPKAIRARNHRNDHPHVDGT
jgi:hypothetical protein